MTSAAATTAPTSASASTSTSTSTFPPSADMAGPERRATPSAHTADGTAIVSAARTATACRDAPAHRLRRRRSRLAPLIDLATLLVRGGRWWLVPFVAVIALAAVLLAAVQVVEYVAPFVYTLF